MFFMLWSEFLYIYVYTYSPPCGLSNCKRDANKSGCLSLFAPSVLCSDCCCMTRFPEIPSTNEFLDFFWINSVTPAVT